MKEIDAFLEYLKYERNYSKETTTSYSVDLLQFEEFAKECELELKEVNPNTVREWIVQMMDKGYNASSINRKLSALRSFYKYLLKQGEITADPMTKISGPKKKKPLPVFVKEKEMDRLLDDEDFGEGFKGCRDKLIIQLFYETGMRLAELVGLNDADVDFGAKVIKVTGKRNKQRLIPFGTELADAMQNYLSVRAQAIETLSDAFITNESGGRIERGKVQQIVRQNLSKVTTVKKRSPHVLRHTFATTMLNHQAELGAIKEILGHESLATTEVYTHTTFEELKKAYNQAHPRA
ncbi:MAG: tyrosine recombinase XerC [Bacteroidaceae bacterium]|jgi:integrase/recombinase XerC|nr:tyrosine recombinase XerC [Bacteroidaceae bacterium]MBR1541707.1 tyrosine recombinase XerC [Bacteroidaceae bacterium]